MTTERLALTDRVQAGLGLHEKLAWSHTLLARGQVWCRTCGHTQRVDSVVALRTGWPKHCGYTMTIDSPAKQIADDSRVGDVRADNSVQLYDGEAHG